MSEIYSNASQVLAYLGFKDHVEQHNTARATRCLQKVRWDVHDHDQLKDFLSHPYFNRIWVVQEISLAKLVVLHTEDDTAYWTGHTVQMLTSFCKDRKLDLPGVVRWVPATQLGEHGLLDLLHRARHCFATDPRDKIFALFGFLHAQVQNSLPIDYTMRTEQVYTSVASYLVATTQQADLLQHVLPNRNLDLGTTPSWVPDWRKRDYRTSMLPPFTRSQKLRFVTRYVKIPRLKYLPNAFSKFARTRRETDWTEYSRISSGDDISTWYRCSRSDCCHKARVEPRTGTSSGPPSLRVHAYRLDMVSNRRQYNHFSNQESYPRQWEYLGKELSELSDVIIKCSDKKEHFGIVHTLGFLNASNHEQPLLQDGDVVWAINGLDVPVVLRQVDHHYILIAPCYLHGAAGSWFESATDLEIPLWSTEPAIIEIW